MRFLIEAPRWMLLFLLVFAPWAYGSTRPWAIDFLIQTMPLVILLWLVGCAVQRRWPTVHPLFIVLAAFLFVQGWGMIANAQTSYDREGLKFIPKEQIWKSGPGVVDQDEAIPIMLRITGLLGIVAFASDLSQRERWRRRIAWTIAFTAGTLILYGIIQRMLGAPTIFWGDSRPGDNFFATYYYHANAAAYINLVLPIVAGLAFVAFRSKSANAQRAFWLPIVVITFAGAVATASKAGVVITVLISLALVIATARRLFAAWAHLPSPALKSITIAAVTLGLFAMGWFGWSRMSARWTDQSTVSESSNQRLLAYQTCLKMIPDAGAWGFGPGEFVIVFPYYTNALGSKIEGIWRFAHNDYLQTLLEWGWTGLAVGAIACFGGMIAALRAYLTKKQTLAAADRVLLVTILIALSGVALHAIVDFPLQIASLQLYVAVYLGIAWGSGRWKPSRAGAEASAS
jgi:O-antigen ligase